MNRELAESVLQLVKDLDHMLRAINVDIAEHRELVTGPQEHMRPGPSLPHHGPRTPNTAQRYLRQSRRRTQGRKGRLPARVKP